MRRPEPPRQDPKTKLIAAGLEIEVRRGTASDVPLLMSSIEGMGEFETLQVHATEDGLRESLFGKHRAAHTLLAFVRGVPVAYVVYFFTFATMVGKRGLWLDDIFVIPEFRERGIGTALMASVSAARSSSPSAASVTWVMLTRSACNVIRPGCRRRLSDDGSGVYATRLAEQLGREGLQIKPAAAFRRRSSCLGPPSMAESAPRQLTQ